MLAAPPAAAKNTTAQEIIFCSGFGKHHTDKSKETGVHRENMPGITWPEIQKLVDNPQQVDKSKGRWVIPSDQRTRVWKTHIEKGRYCLLWADIDQGNLSLDDVLAMIEPLGCDYEIYSSRSATEEARKWRVLIPLAEALCYEDWNPAAETLNDQIAHHDVTPDRSSEGPGQVCFLPNCGEYYEIKSRRDGALFDPISYWHDEIATKKEELEKAEQVNQAMLEERARMRESRLKNVDDSITPIERFNAMYSIEDILWKAGYEDKPGTTQWRHPNSESGSYSASVKDGRVHSLSTSDPLYTGGGGGGAHDAFSAYYTIFHGGDDTEAAKSVSGRLVGTSVEAALQCFDDLTVPTQSKKTRLKLVYAGELLKESRPLEWLVHGYLMPESLALVFGAPESGKSLFCIDWSACIALGRDWNGRTTKQGAVVYIAGEGHFGISRRLKAWAIANAAEERLADAPLLISDRGSMINTKEGLLDVAEAIDAIKEDVGRPVLIVVDTLHRNMTGDENSAQDMGAYFNSIDVLKNKYGCAVLTVHHSGHGEATRSRGSSAIRAALDTELCVDEKAAGVRHLSATKMKDGPRPDLTKWELEVIELPWSDAQGNAESSVVLKQIGPVEEFEKAMTQGMTIAIESFFDAADELGSYENVPLNVWRNKFYSTYKGNTNDSNRQAFLRQRDDLVDKKIIVVKDNKYTMKSGGASEYLDLTELVAPRKKAIDMMNSIGEISDSIHNRIKRA